MPCRPHTWGSVRPELAAAGRFTPPPRPPPPPPLLSLLFLHLTATPGTTHGGGGASPFAPSCHVRAVVYSPGLLYVSPSTPFICRGSARPEQERWLARKERQRPASHLDPSRALLLLDRRLETLPEAACCAVLCCWVRAEAQQSAATRGLALWLRLQEGGPFSSAEAPWVAPA